MAATAVVLAGETAWALLVSVSNDLYTSQFMILAVLSVAVRWDEGNELTDRKIGA
jgi:hypothetical protein